MKGEKAKLKGNEATKGENQRIEIQPHKADMKANGATKSQNESTWSDKTRFCALICFHFGFVVASFLFTFGLLWFHFLPFWPFAAHLLLFLLIDTLDSIGSPSQQKLLCWRTLAQATKSLGFRVSHRRCLWVFLSGGLLIAINGPPHYWPTNITR